MPSDNVVERIRKLLRQAGDAGATEAEAASALERANALLLRENLTMDQVAVSTGTAEAITEEATRTGWAGNWRAGLLAILARHNLCTPITSRRGKVDTVITVGRQPNVQATLTMYSWIAAQIERFALEEWHSFNRDQKAAVADHPDVPWCVACEDWTATYRERGVRRCEECDRRVLPERPLIHGFTWKTAFYRGILLRIFNRLSAQRKAQTEPRAAALPSAPPLEGASVTALVLRTDEENAAYIHQHYGETHKPRSRQHAYHSAAFARGQERGSDVSLTAARALRGGGK